MDGFYVHNNDWLFAAIGVAVALWCIALTLYVVRSDSKEKFSSLHDIAESFATLLISLGEHIRESKRA